MKWRTGAAAAVFVVWVFAAPAGQSQQVEWFTYGGDPASSKYSPADDITPQNVARLAIAWQWEHREKPLEQYGTTPYAGCCPGHSCLCHTPPSAEIVACLNLSC